MNVLFEDRIELIRFITGIFIEFSWLRETTLPPFPRFYASSSPRSSSPSSRNYIIRGCAVVGVDESQNCSTRFVIEIVSLAKDDKWDVNMGTGLMYQGGDARSRVINKSPSRRLTPLFLYKDTNLVDLLLALSFSMILQDERG